MTDQQNDDITKTVTPGDLDTETARGTTSSLTPIITSFVPPTANTPADTMVRMRVSYALLALLSLVIFAAFYALFQINFGTRPPSTGDDNADAARLMSLMNIVFGPVVTLFSSVVGFYFGARTAKEGTGN